MADRSASSRATPRPKASEPEAGASRPPAKRRKPAEEQPGQADPSAFSSAGESAALTPARRRSPAPPSPREPAAPKAPRSPKPRTKPKAAPAKPRRKPRHVPLWWVTAALGVFMLVPAGLLSFTFFQAFSHVSEHPGFFISEEFWFFGLGFALWCLWFAGSIWALGHPRPLRVYIFGHELTHAVWVYLCGGRVSAFKVHKDGGYILTDTTNVWIALAPYFYPIYSLAVIVAYGLVSLFYDVLAVQDEFLWMTPLQWLFLLLGITWSFHFTFTLWIIPKGQSDLEQYGTFFSMVLIYLLNIAILSVALITVAPEVTWAGFGGDLLRHTETLCSTLYHLVSPPAA